MPGTEKKIPMTAFDMIIESAGILVIILLWVLTMFSFVNLQEIIPIHFDASGRVTKWGQKTTLLFFPITATVIFVGLTILNRYPRYFNTVDWNTGKALQQLKYSMRTLRVLKLSIATAFCLVVSFTHFVLDGQPSPLGPWLLPAMLVVILAPVAYYVVKLTRM